MLRTVEHETESPAFRAVAANPQIESPAVSLQAPACSCGLPRALLIAVFFGPSDEPIKEFGGLTIRQIGVLRATPFRGFESQIEQVSV